MITDIMVHKALDAEIDSDGEILTLRQYLRKLLLTLWQEQDGFSGKRPFGNSGWDADIFVGLVKANLLEGTLDEDGYLETCDDTAGDKLVADAITLVFEEKN